MQALMHFVRGARCISMLAAPLTNILQRTGLVKMKMGAYTMKTFVSLELLKISRVARKGLFLSMCKLWDGIYG